MHERVGEREELGQLGLLDKAEIEHVGLYAGGDAVEKRGRVETGAHEARRHTTLVEQRDREVELTHLGLVDERVAAGEDDDFFVVAQAKFGAEFFVGGLRRIERKIERRREQLSRHAGRDELGKFFDDVRDAIGNAQEILVAERMRQAVDEPEAGLVRGLGAEGGERFSRVSLDQEALVVLKVDDEPGGLGEEALVGEDELADAFAGRPRVDQVGGFAVGKQAGLGEEFIGRRGDEQWIVDGADRVLALRDGDDARVTPRSTARWRSRRCD